MNKAQKTTHMVVADNPKTGAPVIEAMLDEKDAASEADRLKKAGMRRVRVTPTKDPAGSAG